MDVCSFDGCNKPVRYQGLCNAHYYQRKRGEKLKPLQIQHHGLSETQRFLRRVNIGCKSECWEWQGSRNKPGWHGQWRSKGGAIELTHRAAFRLFRGEIPEGMHVLHRCDNPACVNPDHLFLGTQSDNAKDMWAKKRARPKRQIGEQHGMAKLTASIVLEIRASTESGKAIAERLGIATTTVCDIRKRRTWKHI